MPADVLIVGAGIAGIATAWALTERGVTDVVIVDRRPPLSLTSNRPEANYRTWWPHPAMVDLATRSLEIIRDLIDDGADIPLDRRGYLYISESEAGSEALGGIVARHPATRSSRAAALDEREIHRRWPHLGPKVSGGIFVPNAGGLDALALGRAMLDRAIARGARVVQTDITELDTSGRRTLINAAGPYARELAQSWGGDLPLETVLRQKVVVRDLTRAIPRDAPFTITLDGRSIPWSAADRKRLGASAEGRRLLKQLPVGIHVKPDDSAGPDALKIGWAWDQRPVAASDDPRVPPDFPHMVQLAASTFIPALAPDLPVVAHEGGFYARTPDGRPLIGAVDVDRFVVAGFAGFGAMMACAAGELAAALITGTDVDAATAAAFDPRRFDDATYLEAIGAGKVVTGEL
jgi:glycine/D-amino acid oxidase-like deaminating enzyme